MVVRKRLGGREVRGGEDAGVRLVEGLHIDYACVL